MKFTFGNFLFNFFPSSEALFRESVRWCLSFLSPLTNLVIANNDSFFNNSRSIISNNHSILVICEQSKEMTNKKKRTQAVTESEESAILERSSVSSKHKRNNFLKITISNVWATCFVSLLWSFFCWLFLFPSLALPVYGFLACFSLLTCIISSRFFVFIPSY